MRRVYNKPHIQLRSNGVQMAWHCPPDWDDRDMSTSFDLAANWLHQRRSYQQLLEAAYPDVCRKVADDEKTGRGIWW